MHRSRFRFRAVLSAAALAILAAAPDCFAQGSLTPPGAPAPTMKSLDQLDAKLERRVPIDSLAGDANYQHVISTPGSYYLRGNLAGIAARGGIRVAVGDVNLDLNGFVLAGVAGSLVGINVDAGARHVTLRNGSLSGWTYAILGNGEALVADVTVRNCSLGGINLNQFGIVQHAQVSDCNNLGISAALVSDCVVRSLNSSGALDGIIARQVRGCLVENLIAGTGATGISGELLSQCEVINIQGAAATGLNSLGVPATDASHCRVVTITATAGSAYGARSFATTSQCTIRSVTGTEFVYGVFGENVNGCDVEIVQTGATGTACGISGGQVNGGNVRYVGSTNDIANGISATQVCDVKVNTVTGTTANGVISSSAHRSSVYNITGTNGSAAGITANDVSGCRIQSVTATTSIFGIEGGGSGVINDCFVSVLSGSTAGNNSACGIRALTITGCMVQGLAANLSASARGINGVTVHQCTVGYVNSTANSGVSGITGTTVTGCTVNNITNTTGQVNARGIGISSATIGSTIVGLIERNTIVACTNGIEVTGANRIVGNFCRDNSNYGIRSGSGSTTVTDNHTEGGNIGFSISGAGNFVVRNVSVGDTTAFSISATSRYAPIVVGAGAGVAFDPLANVDL